MTGIPSQNFDPSIELSALGLQAGDIVEVGAADSNGEARRSNVYGMLAMRAGLVDGPRLSKGLEASAESALQSETGYAIGLKASQILMSRRQHESFA